MFDRECVYAAILLSLFGNGVALAGSPNPWRLNVEAGVLHQSETSVDAGGEFQVDRFSLRGGGSRRVSSKLRVGVSLGLDFDRYDFTGVHSFAEGDSAEEGFAELDPWAHVRRLRLSVPIQYMMNDDWMLFGSPSLRFEAESDASLADGQTFGLIAGASYRINENLTLGPGIGIFSELEEDMSFFPLLLIDWKLTDALRLEAGGGRAAKGGPGLQLRWAHSPSWEIAIGGRYEKRRFRLDDTGVAPSGVGEDRAVPIYGLVRFSFARNASLQLQAGTRVAGSLKIENAAGQEVTASDVGSGPFWSGSLQLRF